jgi:hypothetical protein
MRRWTAGDPSSGVQSVLYWSSTTNAQGFAGAWVVLMSNGRVSSDGKTLSHRAWPVCGGQ